MPGLVGIISKGPAVLRREELSRMTACLHGKDRLASGVFIDEKLGVYAGWTCHRDSYADSLPITSALKDVTLLFAGEHYSSEQADDEFPATGSHNSSDSASGLLPLYYEKGESFLSCLNGFFHGLIMDHRKGSVTLFNDRYGMQRLYYHEDPEAFYFAAEAKAILAVRPELRSFDLIGLGEWLSCGAVLENRSLFKGIQVLPAAARWIRLPGGSIDRSSYFSPSAWENQMKLGPGEFYSRLRSSFRRRLPSYLRSKGRIGLSTTAGLDTRMILANLEIDKDRLHCYSFNGPYRENLDVSIGRRVARAAGFPHTTITIKNDFFDRFGQLAEHVVLSTDGNLELSGAPNLYVNEICRDISPIRLTGNYGSEVLRRHRAFSPSLSACPFLDPGLAESVKSASGTWLRAKECDRLTFIAFKQIPWYSFNRLQGEQSLVTMRSPFMDNFLVELLYRAPAEATASNDVSLRLIADGDPQLGRIMTDRGVTYPRTLLWPFWRAYYEFIFKMEYYAGHGMPRSLGAIDRRLGPLSIERLFLGRNKYYHLRQWFRDELSPYVKDILLDERTLRRDYLNRHAITRAVQKHLSGDENHTLMIDKLLTIELTHRLLLETR